MGLQKEKVNAQQAAQLHPPPAKAKQDVESKLAAKNHRDGHTRFKHLHSS